MQDNDHPVVNVSFDEANQFCRWLSDNDKRECRLPTESEWIFACYRSVKKPLYDFSSGEWGSITSRVGRYGTGMNGVSDVRGNVFEWVTGERLGPETKFISVQAYDKSEFFKIFRSGATGDPSVVIGDGECTITVENEKGTFYQLGGCIGFRVAFFPPPQ